MKWASKSTLKLRELFFVQKSSFRSLVAPFLFEKIKQIEFWKELTASLRHVRTFFFSKADGAKSSPSQPFGLRDRLTKEGWEKTLDWVGTSLLSNFETSPPSLPLSGKQHIQRKWTHVPGMYECVPKVCVFEFGFKKFKYLHNTNHKVPDANKHHGVN